MPSVTLAVHLTSLCLSYLVSKTDMMSVPVIEVSQDLMYQYTLRDEHSACHVINPPHVGPPHEGKETVDRASHADPQKVPSPTLRGQPQGQAVPLKERSQALGVC